MRGKITKRAVDAISGTDADIFLWDTEVKGFGLKVTPKGKKIYVLQYRVPGRSTPQRFTIGPHGAPWTPDEARDEAIRLLGGVKGGKDPAIARDLEKAKKTVGELCDQYLLEGCETKKPSTVATDTGRIKRHIKPLLGRMFVKDVTPNDVRRFMNDVAKGKTAADVTTEKKRGRARVTGGKGTASRTVGLLGGIFSFAIAEGMRTDNPVRGVKRFTDKRGERFLSSKELSKLGDALAVVEAGAEVVAELERQRAKEPTRAERARLWKIIKEKSKDAENTIALTAIRLLILTGCRKSEILSLRWSEVDFDHTCLRLSDSKTGEKVVMLGAPALEILEGLDRIEDCPYVLPAGKGDGHFVGLPKVWERVRTRAGLEGVRLHDLRHSFISVGVGAGMGLPIIGKLVGHRDPKTTARYAHIADDPAKAAADRIAASIAAQMKGEKAEIVSIRSGEAG